MGATKTLVVPNDTHIVDMVYRDGLAHWILFSQKWSPKGDETIVFMEQEEPSDVGLPEVTKSD